MIYFSKDLERFCTAVSSLVPIISKSLPARSGKNGMSVESGTYTESYEIIRHSGQVIKIIGVGL